MDGPHDWETEAQAEVPHPLEWPVEPLRKLPAQMPEASPPQVLRPLVWGPSNRMDQNSPAILPAGRAEDHARHEDLRKRLLTGH